MKTFLWVMVLMGVVYLMYRHERDYGLPWQAQVEIVRYESVKRSWGQGGQIYVHGEVRNATRKPLQATIECRVLPAGMTLTPKGQRDVQLKPGETVPFDLELTSRQQAEGADCSVAQWKAEGGFMAYLASKAATLVSRIRRMF